MADNKNQHYVPRCHLRPFSRDGEGAAINLYNLRLNRCVNDAPIKSQCSRSYFYGDNLELEKVLQGIEGPYATAVAALGTISGVVPDSLLNLLRDFAFLQFVRTKNAVRRRRETMEAMYEISTRGFKDISGLNIDPLDVSHRAMLIDTMRTFVETRAHLEDLRLVIIRNETELDFVTSDDPAILTNRVYLQMLGEQSFGLASCGVQLVLPLTTKFAFVAYDRHAYQAPQRSGNWLRLTRESDVLALNELQYLKCEANIYFHEWRRRGDIAADFHRIAQRRPIRSEKFWVGMQAEELPHGDTYRRATEDEIASPATKIISFSPIFPVPSRWFSGLPFREKVLGWDSGTGAGYVREEYARANQRKARFQRVRVRPGLRGRLSREGPATVFHRRSETERREGS